MNGKEQRKLTQDDVVFLACLSEELNTQGTYGNADPRFFTVKDEKEETCWSENSEYWAIIDDEGNKVGEVDYEVDAGDLLCVPMHKRSAVVEDTLFLTHREAEEHIAANRHHYNNPHPYVQTAVRSPQFEQLVKILREVDWSHIGNESGRCEICTYKTALEASWKLNRETDAQVCECSRCGAEISRDDMSETFGYKCELEAAGEDASTAWFYLCESCQIEAEHFLRGVDER